MTASDELNSLLEGIEVFRTDIGPEWLEREAAVVRAHLQADTSGGRGPRRTFHPAARLFSEVKQHVASSARLKSTRDLVRLGLLGQQISMLNRAGVAGVSERVQRLRSDNWDLFASTAFELEIAALHAQIGRTVQFVEESSSQTPDLLIDGNVEVECKSVRQLTQRDENNREMWSQLQRKLWSRSGGTTGFYFEFETKHDVRQEDIAWVLTHFSPTQVDDHVIQEANRRLRIMPLDPKTEGTGVTCALPSNAPPLEAFDVGRVEMTMQVKDGLPTGSQQAHIFAFRTTDKPDWHKRTQRLLRQARKQFSKGLPALVFIEFQALEKGGRTKSLVKAAVADLFRQSGTISAVVACFTTLEQVEVGEVVRRSYEFERNGSARHPVPPAEVYFSRN